MSAVRSRSLAARLWWALLPYAGCYGYSKEDGGRWAWWMRFSVVPYFAWKLVGRLPRAGPFEPMAPVDCKCDYCLGLTDVWTP